LCVVGLAWFYGPRSQSSSFDLYTGAMTFSRRRLGVRWTREVTDAPHVIWARKHRRSKDLRSFGATASFRESGWFDGGYDADCFWADIPLSLYTSELPEAEKVRLLREYHADLDAMLDSPSYSEYPPRQLNVKWLKKIDEHSATPPDLRSPKGEEG